MAVIVLLFCVGRAYIKVPRVCCCAHSYEHVPEDGVSSGGINDVLNDRRDDAM